jgi:hypothetical protein
MRGIRKANTPCPADVRQHGGSVTVGIDLGDRKSCVCILDSWGEIVCEEEITTSPFAFRDYFQKMGRAVAALEVGMHSRWASRVVRDCGHEPIVANASKGEVHLCQ